MYTAAMTIPAPLLASARTRTGSPDPMDEARFEAFYRRTAGGLWAYLHRLTGDAAAADDLLQKTFYRFLRANPAVASDDHRRRWLFRAATNLAFDYFRQSKRERVYSESTLPDPAHFAVPGAREAMRHDMSRVFGELKPRERALLWLAHVEEAGHEDIAEALGVKLGSVKVLLFRARKRLGELLKKSGLAPETTR